MTDEYETPDETAARIMADLLTPSVPAGLLWPAPESNPHCICKPNPLAMMFCQVGHMTECHYPYGCDMAACSHLVKYDYTVEEVQALTAKAFDWLQRELSPYYRGENWKVEIIPLQDEDSAAA